ncbi:17860_t:CDS:2 [Funneliformis geosporum]|nr:17860_t:CDS:2 [Funneliformis geosporum]
MREVAKYCIIDALSYQRLMIKCNVINEYREVTSIVFISLFDTHYFAIGMKVHNLLSAGAWQEGILTSTIPCKQTETGKYPGVYVFPPVKGLENRRYVTSLDFRVESLKESEHGNQAEMKGLYPKKRRIRKEISLVEARGENITDALKSECSLVSFIDACLDVKSLTLKVYINTFYGEAKNSGFSFFLQVLAGGVTSADSLYLVCSEECFQKCDEAYDNGNGISKEEYWSKMVNTSMEVIERLRDEVNNFLRNDNGSSYLKMAYKKVLFLVVFTGKKKYYGIPHRRESNFNNKLFIRVVEVVKWRQSKHFCEVGKKVMNESMKMDNLHTLYQIVKDVLKEIINDILQIDLNGIVKTAVWKPDKNNKSV